MDDWGGGGGRTLFYLVCEMQSGVSMCIYVCICVYISISKYIYI